MSKYVGGYEYRQRTNPQHRDSFGAALAGIADAIAKQQQQRQDEELIERMNDPNLSEMERAKLALQLSPKGQQVVMQVVQLHRKLMHEQELARRHQDEIDVRREREQRLGNQNASKDLEKAYKSRLSDIKDQLKDTYNAKDRKPLQDEQKALQKELGQNLARVKRGENPRFDVLQVEEDALAAQRQGFDTMNQMSGGPNQNIAGATPGINPNAQTSYTPNAPQNMASNATALRQQPAQQQMNAPQQAQPQAQVQRQRWNPQDPSHAAFAAEVFKSTGGDRSKTNAILAEQFER